MTSREDLHLGITKKCLSMHACMTLKFKKNLAFENVGILSPKYLPVHSFTNLLLYFSIGHKTPLNLKFGFKNKLDGGSKSLLKKLVVKIASA